MGFVSIRFVGGVLPSYSHLFLYSLAIFILMAFSFTGEYDDVTDFVQAVKLSGAEVKRS